MQYNFFSIGVIGQGFVGKAIADAFSKLDKCRVATYDKYKPELSTNSMPALVDASDIIFVCVPTPASVTGKCDTSIVHDVISQVANNAKGRKTVVIKSTVPPTTCEGFRYDNLGIVFNPEFLNARSAYDDFMRQDHIILGHDGCDVSLLVSAYNALLPDAQIVEMGLRSAELLKYTKNAFFAVKVSFFNEIYQICSALGVDYSSMVQALSLDDRIGWEHLKVPGPTPGADGEIKFGFGGMCLPKDLRGLMHIATQYGVNPLCMNAAWEKNLEVRPERDWEQIPGAVTDKVVE